MKVEEKIEIIKKALKIVKHPKAERCLDFNPGCMNCSKFMTYDYLNDFLGNLKWELRNSK